MRRIYYEDSWRDSWKASYEYDLMEVYETEKNSGYASAYRSRKAQTINLLKEAVRPPGRVLDVAAAQGNFSIALSELGYEVTWNDLRDDLIDYVRLKNESSSIHFAPGNAFELEFPSLFDAVLITEIIEHVAHPDEFLKKVADLVKPGGHIIMTTPNGEYFRNDLPKFSECPNPDVFESLQFGPNAEDHIFLLHQEEIESFAASAGLEVEKIILFTNPLTNGHIGLEPVTRLAPRFVIGYLENLSQRLPLRLRRKMLVHTAARFRKPTPLTSSSLEPVMVALA